MNKIHLLLLGMLLLPAALSAKSPNNSNILYEESKARATIISKAKDAVVHIKAEKIIRGRQGGGYNNPYDLFNDEFFERFFPGIRPPQSPRSPHNRQRQPYEQRQEGMGSGAIINEEGYILTNHHVAGDADKIIVKLADGREFEAKLIGTDAPTDVAVIKIEGDQLPVLPLGNSDEMLVGETVVAIGNPFGLTLTVTSGIISATGRSNIGVADYENFIQTDAAINPGNSGGPLINLKGEIIGVNTAIFTRSGGYQGIGFAIPINMARSIMDDLIGSGSVARGWLGVSIQDINSDLAKTFGLESTQGALIAQVMPNTPASKAGIQRGDIIIKLNGKLIKDSNSLRNEVAAAKAGSNVEVILIRQGQQKTLQVELGLRPGQAQAEQSPQETTPKTEETLGFAAQELTPELAQRLQVEMESGVLITRVEPGSPAARAQLQRGMVLSEVNQQPVATLKQLQQALDAASIQDGILLLVRTRNGSRYLILKER